MSTIDGARKRFWVVTASNVAVLALLLLTLYSLMLALAVIAPYISTWPLFCLLGIGVILSFLGLRLARKVQSRQSRIIGYLVTGCVLAVHIVVVLGILALVATSVEERFIISDGYKGDVYVIFNASNGTPVEKSFWGYTYRIPEDGVLLTQGAMVRRWTRDKYYYKKSGGNLTRIPNFWPSTIQSTPENLANEKDLGIYFPRTGMGDFAGCQIEYEQFYVGTKADLLKNYKEKDLARYLREHSMECGVNTK